MKKIILSIMLGLAIFLSDVDDIAASKIKCGYAYNMTRVYVTYEYNKELIKTVEYEHGNQNNTIKNVKDDIVFVPNDFINENNDVYCPNATVVLGTVTGKNRRNISIKADKDGDLTGEIIFQELDDKEKNPIEEEPHNCVYHAGEQKEFSLYWSEGKLNYNLRGSMFYSNSGNLDFTVSVTGNFTEEDFSNNKCPDAHILVQTKQGINKVIISDEDILTNNENGVEADKSENINDGSVNEDYVPGATDEETDWVDTNSGKVTCDSLFGSPNNNQDPAYWIQWCLDVLKYIAIIALLVLSSADFLKAIISNDKDALKKASMTTAKRFIFAVLIFFLPIIVEVIMKLFGAYGTCNLG